MEHQHKQDQKNFKKQKHYCNKLNKGYDPQQQQQQNFKKNNNNNFKQKQ